MLDGIATGETPADDIAYETWVLCGNPPKFLEMPYDGIEPLGPYVETRGNVRFYCGPGVDLAMIEAAERARKAAAEGGAEPEPAAGDDPLALAFAERNEGQFKYCAPWGRWLVWNGTSWAIDDRLLALDAARAVCREAGERERSLRLVAAVERLARTDRRIGAGAEQWDRDPWLVATPGGTVDLRTGILRAGDRGDYCSKATAVAPGGPCPRWLDFLARITAGDAALQAYLKRVAGYCLTGTTGEQALFFGHGTGANGKSVFLNALAGAMGDYAAPAPTALFTGRVSKRQPETLAALRAVRLAGATEIAEEMCWAETRVKALTGGDTVMARLPRHEPFAFRPEFKLLIVGNHKPHLSTIDEAIRRRIHLIPFAVTIPDAERDPLLGEKLAAEWPGILAWMIEGCREWQAQGLAPPDAVRRATAEYLDAEDLVQHWIDECCELRPDGETPSAALYASWEAWAKAAGEAPGSKRRLTDRLASRGYPRIEIGHAKKRGLGCIGLRPRADAGVAGAAEPRIAVTAQSLPRPTERGDGGASEARDG